jgi:hypothetical protein
VFVDADQDGAEVLAHVNARDDLPAPSYVLHSSPGRLHLFWRVAGFTVDAVEAIQRRLARELGTDLAATSASQMTRLVGFFNHKYVPAHSVGVEYHAVQEELSPHDFPDSTRPAVASEVDVEVQGRRESTGDAVERARRYLGRVPPAISGQHGDERTFRVCCRLVRGFGLSEDEAIDVLSRWNSECVPAWSKIELRDKLQRARRLTRGRAGVPSSH